MFRKKEKGISLLLAGFLALSACSAPGAESPTPTLEPTPTATETPTPTPSPTPESTPTPPPPTVAMERPDLTGEWHRTDCHSSYLATLNIYQQTDEGFSVDAECWYFSHSGTWRKESARFIGESIAVVENYGYDLGSGEEYPPVKFTWEGDTLIIETDAADYQLGFGFNVNISGTYTRGEPEYTNAGVIDECLTATQQELLKELGDEIESDVLTSIKYGALVEPIVCLLADGRQGTLLETFMPTAAYYNFTVIFTDDGKVYVQREWDGFHTNDTTATEMPEILRPKWDDTNDYFFVPTGGRLGTVLVTVEIEDAEEYHFSIWTSDNLAQPFQTMTAESYGVFHWNDVVDANFDGYMDFCYMYAMGNQPGYWHYWIWNEEQGLFVAEPEFDQISWPQFDEETGIISGWARSSCCSGVETYHRWENGKLVCVRRIDLQYPEHNEDGTYNQLATVEDRINGEMTEVFREYCTNEEPSDTYPFEEVWKWRDLNYHGE